VLAFDECAARIAPSPGGMKRPLQEAARTNGAAFPGADINPTFTREMESQEGAGLSVPAGETGTTYSFSGLHKHFALAAARPHFLHMYLAPRRRSLYSSA